MTLLPLLDQNIFTEAKDLLQDKFPAILGYFIEDSTDYAAAIRSALALNDLHAMILPAHSIKSSARQIGALRLSEIARTLELGAKEAPHQQPAPDFTASIGELEQALQETSDILREWLAS